MKKASLVLIIILTTACQSSGSLPGCRYAGTGAEIDSEIFPANEKVYECIINNEEVFVTE
jgi:hypothetical protein